MDELKTGKPQLEWQNMKNNILKKRVVHS